MFRNTLALVTIYIFFCASCNKDESPSEWKNLAEYPGNQEYFTSASYNDLCFIFFGGTQGDLADRPAAYKSNVWMYDRKQNKWSPKKSYEGLGKRANASAFTIGENIYVIGGSGPRDDPSEWSELNEFLQYDPLTDSWIELERFPGQPRSGALSFVVDNVAYFGLGSSDRLPLKDFWQYNPATKGWRKLKDFPGQFPKYYSGSIETVVYSKLINFVYEDKIFIVSGVDYTHPEMWSFNTSTEEWTEVTDIQFEDDDPLKRNFNVYSSAMSVTYKDNGYFTLGLGMNEQIGSSGVYRYNFTNSSWRFVGAFPGDARICAFSFVLNDQIILGTDYNVFNPKSSSFYKAQPYELWSYRPNSK